MSPSASEPVKQHHSHSADPIKVGYTPPPNAHPTGARTRLPARTKCLWLRPKQPLGAKQTSKKGRHLNEVLGGWRRDKISAAGHGKPLAASGRAVLGGTCSWHELPQCLWLLLPAGICFPHLHVAWLPTKLLSPKHASQYAITRYHWGIISWRLSFSLFLYYFDKKSK